MERESGHWQARLPADLVEHVAWPVRMQSFHDDGLPASKWRGYDALGLLCYYRHVYSRWSTDFDEANPDSACELIEQEDFEAWRTLLGTWVRRIQRLRPRQAGDPPGVSHADEHLFIDTRFEIVTARDIPRL